MNTWNVEVRESQQVRRRFVSRCKKLKMLYKIKSKGLGDTLEKLLRRVSDKQSLKKEYEKTCKELVQKLGVECVSTRAEKYFRWIFCRRHRVKIYSQVWIGNLCVDFFVPAWGYAKKSKGFEAKGVVFEIDGWIHNLSVKAKKDLSKERVLEDMKILVWRIPNREVYHDKYISTSLVAKMNFKRLCSRARVRLWNKICLVTLLYHASDETIRDLFPKMNTASKMTETV